MCNFLGAFTQMVQITWAWHYKSAYITFEAQLTKKDPNSPSE